MFKIITKTAAYVMAYMLISGCTVNSNNTYPVLNHSRLAAAYYGNDTSWYLENIPFFECSDKQIQDVYYYRWKMYKAHVRSVGDNQFVITEFINHVPWDREPYCTIDAATMLHIHEGRWLKDSRFMDGYINNMLQYGGDNRHYSESIADAAWARYLVSPDSAFIISQLDSMVRLYNDWSDHYDSVKQLYYIPAMPDATEYTIASVDASNGKGGFDSGDAYRPTINSYMFANARAIARVAALKGDKTLSDEYLAKAEGLKNRIERDLWNEKLQHFTDRLKQNNRYVHYWDFIRGRELAGMVPWYFELPGDTPAYNAAWRHAIDSTQLLGPYGFRTNEPSYQYYRKQMVYSDGHRGSQWNGPSWPYQNSLVLSGMANFLNDYKQDVVTAANYVDVLRRYTRQHYLPDGKINLVENYDPDNGGPIVYYYWSNHYNHSSYNDLVITGLCGIRPAAGDTLVINPLVDTSIHYLCLDDVLYHGHRLSVVYDRDGERYHLGKGLTVFVDGKKAPLLDKDGKHAVYIGPAVLVKTPKQPVNYALNIMHKGYPMPSASVNAMPDTSLYQAIDGRIWYFTEITNRWTTFSSPIDSTDWYAVDFGRAHDIDSVKLYLMGDGIIYGAPDTYTVEYYSNNQWLPVKLMQQKPAKPVENTVNTAVFDKVNTSRIRVKFTHTSRATALSELECY